MKTKLKSALFALVAGVSTLPGAFAQNYYGRAHTSEFYVLAQYWTADDSVISNVTLPTEPPTVSPSPPITATSDLKYSLKDEWMWGLGYIYNFSDKFAVRAETTFGRPNYEMTWNGNRLTGEAWVNTGKVNLDWNLLSGPFSPFVSAGIGYFYIDTGVPSGPPVYGIWWDYFWGPVVVGTYPTHDDWFFSYNVAAGIRWDINPHSVVRVSVTGNWVDTSRAGTLQTIETNLSYGWKW